jgi:DNA-binding transcriptional LysR family regulator
MDLELPETSELAAFVQIVRTGSISGAAAELRLPRATVSRRLQRLEEKLEVRLLQRTTRRMQLTDLGEAFFPHARSVVNASEAAAEVVRRRDDHPKGLLRVSTPPLQGPFVDAMIDFMAAYPDVELELIASQAHEDLIERNIDVALRAGTSFDEGLTMRRLTSGDVMGAASPAYLKGAPRLRTVDDLAKHRCLVGFTKGLHPSTHWPLRDGGQVRIRGVMTSNDPTFHRRAAERGMGIALLPSIIAQPSFDAGRLVPVLPRRLGATGTMGIVYPERELMKAATRAFIDFVVDYFARGGVVGPA